MKEGIKEGIKRMAEWHLDNSEMVTEIECC